MNITRSLVLLASLAATSLFAANAKVTVGYLPVTGHAKFFVAKEQGFFAQEGIDVELIEFANSADGLNALRAGKLDIGAFGTTAPLIHISKGADLRIIGGVMGEDAAIITTQANSTAIKKVTDLKGKKVATVRLATGDAVLRGALDKNNIDWHKDLQIFELKNPPAVIEAVKSGQVDAGVVWGPHDLRAEEQGLKVVVRSSELAPGHPCCRLTLDNARLQAKEKESPELWSRFLRAFLKAQKFTQENRAATINSVAKYVKLDTALLAKAFYGGHLEQGSDPNLHGVKDFYKTMQNSEQVDAGSPKDIGPFVNSNYYLKALTGLAKESPKDPYWQKLLVEFQKRDL